MRRRIFLRAFLAVCSSVFASGSSAKRRGVKRNLLAHDADDLIMDQSGSFGNGAFAMGALSCKDAAETAKKVAELRVGTRFRCTLTHASRNKWKAEYARRLIDLWIDSSDIKIALLVLRDDKSLKRAKPIEKLSRYTELVSRLIDASPGTKGKRRRIITQAHFKQEPQIKFEEMLTMRNARVGKVVRVSENESDLLQLVDLVVGAVQASQKTTMAPVTNSTKLAVIKHLMGRLGGTSLEEKLRHPRCSVTFV